ncbi:hypothetical protein Shyd_47830 [Streptomyces hydrogenans]|uniref:Uncharacterized protein n=1 Tax=Streptomyces hydrogenans TaxID=1873719 RepID=A0ABQ3PEF9_9ACTN|nr:hypothetical protein Shyd_47830 [Streptomyces hydrogenans]
MYVHGFDTPSYVTVASTVNGTTAPVGVPGVIFASETPTSSRYEATAGPAVTGSFVSCPARSDSSGRPGGEEVPRGGGDLLGAQRPRLRRRPRPDVRRAARHPRFQRLYPPYATPPATDGEHAPDDPYLHSHCE